MKQADQLIGRIGVACFSRWKKHWNPERQQESRRVLIILLSAMGDAINFLPALRKLRERQPHWRIELLTSSRAFPIFEDSPYLDEIISVDIYGGIFQSVGRFWRMVREVKASQYDMIIDTEQYSALTGFVTLLSGAPRRIGFRTVGKQVDRAYTDLIDYAESRHEAHCFIDLLQPVIGKQSYPDLLEPLSLTQQQITEAGQRLYSLGLGEQSRSEYARAPIIAIHPLSSSTATNRRWPAESFIRLSRQLQAEYGARILLIGSAEEAPFLSDLARMIGEPVNVLAGKTSIRELAAIFTYCQLFVGNDSGPMHLAAAMGIPVVGLFGPNTPLKWGPLGHKSRSVSAELPCSPCIRVADGVFTECKQPVCMSSLTPYMVMEVIASMVEKGGVQREVTNC